MNLRRFWSWVWAIAGGFSIRVKIMGIVLVLILILGLGITFQTRNSLVETLTNELESHGVSIARELAARSTDLILTSNFFDLYQLLKDTIDNNDDVRYAFITGPDGSVLSHSFGDGIPVGLAEVNLIEADTVSRLEMLDTDEGLIWDIAVPILGGRAGIARVGMSSRNFLLAVAATTQRLLIYTGIVSLIGLLAAYLLTSVLTKPIVQLVEVTKAIARGDLKRKAPVWALDEVGRLGIAFNSMTKSLAESRSESEAFQQELMRRNRELAALNAIATEVSGAQQLDDIIHRSLSKVLEAVGLMNAGWVSILSEDGQWATLICQDGLSTVTVQKVTRVKLSSCACQEVVSKKLPF